MTIYVVILNRILVFYLIEHRFSNIKEERWDLSNDNFESYKRLPL